MKIGDLVLTRHYVPVHGYIFNVIKICDSNDLKKVVDMSESIVMVSNDNGSFGEEIDRLVGLDGDY